ncbi:MAG: glycerate kinase [Candidatus Infernicultor aquiphilus]|uniref:Glycerate kinase n=2 Tax=Candidatus Infernicultor aquiphilus TaxID=1805029 RepID=A0A2M7PPW2_9BACT|nr:MAG: glycerate kinase [Candidatus Atribacteria bacterium CG_4_10_14_3_um_filter_34_13]
MKIVVAPDSFKGSLTAIEVSDAIEKGIREVFPEAEIIKIPMADGGDGTVQCLVNATGGKILEEKVIGPLGNEVWAFYGILGDRKTAIVEMAAASGLTLVPENKRDPLITTTYGTGQLIKAALNQGCRKMIIGIGGSATNDGGAGMVQALGTKLLDKDGEEIGFGGGELKKIVKIDISCMDKRLSDIKVLAASDVNNPLCGPQGASRIYGPQKGATPEIIEELDESLAYFAELIKRDLHKDIKDIPGAGAAGGLGASLIAFLNAEFRPGIEIMIEAVKLEQAIKDADLVITGEGKIDSQTIYGKAPIGVAKIAKKHNIPVVAVAAIIEEDSRIFQSYGIDTLIKVSEPPMRLSEIKTKKIWLIKKSIKQFLRGRQNLFH